MGLARLVAPVRTVAVRLVGRGGSAVRTCTFIRSISFASGAVITIMEPGKVPVAQSMHHKERVTTTMDAWALPR